MKAKNKKWDRNRPAFFKIGMIVSMCICISAFQLEVNSHGLDYIEPDFTDLDNIMELVPYNPPIQKKKVLPPVAPPITVEDIKVEDDADFTEELDPEPNTDETSNLPTELIEYNEPVIAQKAAPMVKPKDESEEDVDKVELFAEEMPAFGDCAFAALSEAERKDCTAKEMLKFFSKNVRYTRLAKEINIQGTVIAEFVVNKKGQIERVKILRGLGAGLDEEVLRVINKMEGWKPGKQNKRPVNVLYRVPVKFKLK